MTTLVFASGTAFAYWIPLAGVVALVGRRRSWPSRRAFILALAATLALFAVGFTAYESLVLHLRHVPDGGGAERQGYDREHFVATAEAVFAAFYVSLLIVGAVLGFLFARARSRRPARVAVAAAAAVAVFLALTFPFAEFFNACNVGEPFVLDASC